MAVGCVVVGEGGVDLGGGGGRGGLRGEGESEGRMEKAEGGRVGGEREMRRREEVGRGAGGESRAGGKRGQQQRVYGTREEGRRGNQEGGGVTAASRSQPYASRQALLERRYRGGRLVRVRGREFRREIEVLA